MVEVIELSNELDQEVRAGELAEIFGLSPTRIRELALEGVVIRVRRGWYALVPSVRGYIDYWKQRADRNQKPDDQIEKLRALDLRRKTAETIAAEVALQEKLENLTPTNLIADGWNAVQVQAKSAILSVPGKMRTRHGLDSETVKDMTALLEDALNELARADPFPDVRG